MSHRQFVPLTCTPLASYGGSNSFFSIHQVGKRGSVPIMSPGDWSRACFGNLNLLQGSAQPCASSPHPRTHVHTKYPPKLCLHPLRDLNYLGGSWILKWQCEQKHLKDICQKGKKKLGQKTVGVSAVCLPCRTQINVFFLLLCEPQIFKTLYMQLPGPVWYT